MNRTLELAEGLELAFSDVLPKHELVEAAELLRELQAENESLRLVRDQLLAQEEILDAKVLALQSWKMSIEVEVGPVPEMPPLATQMPGDYENYRYELNKFYKQRAEQLAAKYIEIKYGRDYHFRTFLTWLARDEKSFHIVDGQALFDDYLRFLTTLDKRPQPLKEACSHLCSFNKWNGTGYACECGAVCTQSSLPLTECSTLCHPDESCAVTADGQCLDKPLEGGHHEN